MFTSSKLKIAFCHIDEIGKLLVTHIEKRIQKCDSEIVLKEMTVLYTIDVISNVMFGFNPKGLEGKVGEIHHAAASIFKFKAKRMFEFLSCFMMPALLNVIQVELLGSRFTNFVYVLMSNVLTQRKTSNTKRNDFVDLLLELEQNKQLTEKEIIANANVFFVGGKLKL